MENILYLQLFFDDDDEPMNEQVVQVFVEQIRKGVPMPAPVLMKKKDGTYAVVDGRKRLEARYRCGLMTTDAYIIEEVSPERFRELRRSANEQLRPSN